MQLYLNMNRIAHDRVSELSATKVQLFKPVNNWLINFYLDGFKRREKREEEPTILSINYLTLILYVVALTKSLVCFGKLSRTSKLILFDFACILWWHRVIQQNSCYLYNCNWFDIDNSTSNKQWK